MEKITFNVSDEQEKWLKAVQWRYRAPISRILRHILDHEMQQDYWFPEISSQIETEAVMENGGSDA